MPDGFIERQPVKATWAIQPCFSKGSCTMGKAIKEWIGSHLNFSERVATVAQWYLLSLMLPAARHSQTNAAELSGLDKSQFSRFLKNHSALAMAKHQELVVKTFRRIAKQFQKDPSLVSGTPWRIFLIIDSTLHRRTSRHIQNSQKFNHGDGWVIGHQWTNVVIVIGSRFIPLAPIAFHTEDDCKRLGISYETEHDKLVDLLGSLNLSQYLGDFDPRELVVLLDSGYDIKKIQAAILKRGWDFVCALKSNRSVRSTKEFKTKSEGWGSIAAIFKRVRKQAPWQTVYDHTKIAGTKNKRMEFRGRLWMGHLRGIFKPLALVCSEKTNGDRRYLACSNLKVSLGAVIRTYRRRWLIELFHKDIKFYLGLQHAGVKDFDSVISHVHWVYTAYLLLKEKVPDSEVGIQSQQLVLKNEIEINRLNEWIQLSTQFNGDLALRGLFVEEKIRFAA